MINLSLTQNEQKNLSKDEIEIAMARKLEILMLPHLRRHISFFYAGGNLKGKAKAYREVMDKQKVEDIISQKTEETISTVCKPLCEMIVKILKENKIKAETLSCDTDMFRHTDVLLTTSSGKQYIINYLEDMENIQSGMKTPDFASYPYYEKRYKKFNGGPTTDGKSLHNIDFLSEAQLSKIDANLGYKKFNMYMDSVIDQIKTEFLHFRDIMAQNECIETEYKMEKSEKEYSKKDIEAEIYSKYHNLTLEKELELKLDWLFNYFNDRMDITGHTDFTMYYSRILLKNILTPEEYSKINRYDCFAYKAKIPQNSKLCEILDNENIEEPKKSRFCIVEANDKFYMFSKKPNVYVKVDKQGLDEIKQYSHISKTEKPSDLLLSLCFRGNALPLVFHPLGMQLLNQRASLIDKHLSPEEEKEVIMELSNNIITTDEPITSIRIPYPDGTTKLIYINQDDEFVVKTKDKETVYHYNEEEDSFITEERITKDENKKDER